MQTEFKARLSVFSITITLLLNIFIAVVCYILLFKNELLKNTNQPPVTVKYLIIFLLLTAFILAYLLHPVNYSVTSQDVIIHTPIHKKKIPINTILEIEQINSSNLGVRIFGSGGLWGYFGLFNSSHGAIQMHASNLNDLIFISTINKNFIISPENPEEFIKRVYSLKNN